MPKDCKNGPKMTEIFSLIPHICFVGHTHIPGVFLEDQTFIPPHMLWGQTYFIEKQDKALINIGSVGQPRDGDKRSSYVLLDDDPTGPRAIFRRVEYDIEHTAKAIEANSNLDNYLAERLRQGR
jgi:diadenosine tetraphosphatase ApaH/serine/threonine PP2A family protein phosphatase